MIKYTQRIRGLLPTIYLSVFDHFVGFVLKGLRTLHFDPMQFFNESTIIF